MTEMTESAAERVTETASREMPVKQVIVIRSDLKMRRGKEIAQGAHAAMAWLSKRLIFDDGDPWECPSSFCPHLMHDPYCDGAKPDMTEIASLSRAELIWLKGLFTKVVCRVRSEEELLRVYADAKQAGLQAEMITDSGHTEFHDEPTVTCIAIGPDWEHLIDPVTGDLEPY